MREYIEIELTQVNFVPTWNEIDKTGNVLSRHTLVGQAGADANKLPKDLQSALKQFILQELNKRRKGGG